MKKMLFPVCVALAVLGCGDEGDLPECLGLDCIITVYGKCGEWAYDKSAESTEFCFKDSVYTKCGGKNYNPSTELCSGSLIYLKCDGKEYNPKTQYCSNGTIKAYSGTISHGGQTYKTQVIGTQTWFAENLNYDVSGSKCNKDEPDNCIKYGRLYDWSTAMAFPSSCNSSDCSSQKQLLHRGICPVGWHIPSDYDWNVLMDYAEGDSTGTKLNIWNNSNGKVNGTDEFGFSALDGVKDPWALDDAKNWWSASEYYSTYAYNPYIRESNAYGFNSGKSGLRSVRCLRDDEKSSSNSFVSCTNPVTSNGSVTCGGRTYKTVVIGTQTWMAENLNHNVSGSRCNEGNPANCHKYGRLYNWSTAMMLPSSCNSSDCSSQIQEPHRGICPNGWHIPSDYEWDLLINYAGGSSVAGIKLKAASGWRDNTNGSSGNGTNDYGFAALPGGLGDSNGYSGRYVDGSEYNGFWWSANAARYSTHYDDDYTSQDCIWNSCKPYLYSVRCLRDVEYISKGNNINNYRTVVIGTQTWMAENLDYEVKGSKCYANAPAACNTYGRLYDWATAMNLPSSCNSSSCLDQIQTKHRGICPVGWHIPNYDDWDVLMSQVGDYQTAGRHLKAQSGWNPYSGIENLDTYGFSALPGGLGHSGVSFYGVGNYGYWWSASESNSSIAYYRYMYYDYDYAYWHNNYEYVLFSVRCVQD
jgi:uncharacterized protein (TIGR02145 family)